MYAPGQPRSNIMGYDQFVSQLNAPADVAGEADIFMPEERVVAGLSDEELDAAIAQQEQSMAAEEQNEWAQIMQQVMQQAQGPADRMQATRTWAGDIEGAQAAESADAQLQAARAAEGLI